MTPKGDSPQKTQLPPTPKTNPLQSPAPPKFILSLSKDELAPNPHPIPKIPRPNPLTNPKPTFYNNPNAKTSSPQTAPNEGNNGVKSRPG